MISPKQEHLSVVIVVVSLFVALLFFFEPVKEFFESFIAVAGFFGFFIAVFIMDTFIQPVSPDFVVLGLIIANQPPFIVATVAAIASVLGGMAGYGLGRLLWIERKKWYDFLFFWRKERNTIKNAFRKYGVWAVGLSAITPLPYSTACWAAGAFRMPFNKFLLAVLVGRIPRFYLVAYGAALIF